MPRKSPIRHRVKSHTRKNRSVRNYLRGSGTPHSVRRKLLLNPDSHKPTTVANQVLHDLTPYCKKIEVAGSIRRGKPDPKDVDILLIPKSKGAWEQIKKYGERQKNHMRLKGDKIISFWKHGVQVDVYVTEPKGYGSMAMFLTGPSGYNIGLRIIAKKKGMKLNQYGLFNRETGEMIAGKTEESVYQALGKAYKKPSLRGK